MAEIEKNIRPKLLILSPWFIPGYKAGGTIQNIANMATALSQNYSVFVLTSNTDFGSDLAYNLPSDEWVVNDRGFKVNYLPSQQITKKKILLIIKDLQPDFIYLNGIYDFYFNIFPLWLKKRKQIQSEIIVAPNGMLAPSAIKFKSWKKKPFLFLLRILGVHKVSKWHTTSDKETQDVINFFGKNINIIHAPAFPPKPVASITSISKKTGALKLLFLSRIHPIKNLSFVLNILKSCSLDITFNIAGPIEDTAYWEKCKQLISTLPSQVQTNYLGEIPHPKVSFLIQKSHLAILPTKGENYGYIIIETLNQGRPILISDQTPWRNLTKHQVGWDLPLNNPQAFIDAIEEMAAMDQKEYNEWAEGALQYAQSQINISELKEKYFLLFSIEGR